MIDEQKVRKAKDAASAAASVAYMNALLQGLGPVSPDDLAEALNLTRHIHRFVVDSENDKGERVPVLVEAQWDFYSDPDKIRTVLEETLKSKD
jgi:hypothetical protein